MRATDSRSLSEQFSDFACVALLVHHKAGESLLGFIRRAEHPKDPWSGQIGLPGGRRDPEDASDHAAILREVREEIGLGLDSSLTHVRLHDVQARRAGELLPFFLRPFVFAVQDMPTLELDPKEVSAFFWVPLSHLLNPDHHMDYPFERNGLKFKLPAVKLPSGDILWGLTYLVLTDFLQRLDANLAARSEYLRDHDMKRWRRYP